MPQPPNPEPLPKRSQPPADLSPPGPGAAPPKPAAGGALFRALLEAGCDAVVAYTAEKQLQTMTLEIVSAHQAPVLAEMRNGFDRHGGRLAETRRRLDQHSAQLVNIERRLDQHSAQLANIEQRLDEQSAQLADLGRNLSALTRVVASHGEQLAEHGRQLGALAEGAAERDRKLDVLVARLDGLKVLGHVILGALGLLITVLIAVFGFLSPREDTRNAAPIGIIRRRHSPGTAAGSDAGVNAPPGELAGVPGLRAAMPTGGQRVPAQRRWNRVGCAP